jgi:hypothetical protein
MNKEYTAIMKQEDDWWIGWIEEIPGVNCQEHTRDKLIESLRITLIEALEFNRQDVVFRDVVTYVAIWFSSLFFQSPA